jgi:hypothetical protein
MDLDGWEYVVSNGKTFVGKVVHGIHLVGQASVDLSPVFEAHEQIGYEVLEEGGDPVPTGSRTFLTPVFGFGLDSLTIPPGAIRKPLHEVGHRQTWEIMIRGQVEMRAHQKRAASAIGAGPRAAH